MAQEPFQSIIVNPKNYYTGFFSGQSEIISLNDGGYVLKDYLEPSGINNQRIVTSRITRFDKCHNKIWSRSSDSVVINNFLYLTRYRPSDYYPSAYYTYGDDFSWGSNTSITLTSSNNLIIGQLMNESEFKAVPVIIKTDISGRKIWTKKIGIKTLANTFPVSSQVFCRPAGNDGCVVAFSGFYGSTADSFPKPYISITRLDRNGAVVFSKKLGGNVYNSLQNGVLAGLAKTPGGYVLYVAGDANLNEKLIGIDSAGKVLWCEGVPAITGYSASYGNNFTVDAGGNVYISHTNFYYNAASLGQDFIFKFDTKGNLKWLKQLKNTGSVKHNQNIKCICIGKDNRLAIIINYSLQTLQSSRNYILKLNSKEEPDSAVLIKSPNFIEPIAFNCFLQPSADSGTFYADLMYNDQSKYFDIIQLTKFDKNADGSCMGPDTFFSFNTFPFVNISQLRYTVDSGYKVSDTSVVLSKSNLKEKIICAPHLFPIADIGGDTILCSSKSYTLSIGNENKGSSILWSTGSTDTSISVTKSGKYWVSLNSGYCTSVDTATITFLSQAKTGMPHNLNICKGDSVLLSAKDSITQGLYWQTPKKDPQGSFLKANSWRINAKDSGTYYLKLDGRSSCTEIDTIHISFYTLPSATAGPDTTLCYNQTYTMQGAGGITYKWTPAKYLDNDTIAHPKATLPNTQLYILTVKNSHGCSDSAQILLKVRPRLQVKAYTLKDSICYHDNTVLWAVPQGGDKTHYQYNWDRSPAKDSIPVTGITSGWHNIILSDGCSPASASDSVYIFVTPSAKALFSYLANGPLKTGRSVSFLNHSVNAARYLWTFSGTDSSHSFQPVHIFTDSGHYLVSLVAYGLNGCPNDTEIQTIKVTDGHFSIYIPDAFTPNSDGKNDVFAVSGSGIKTYNLQVYNRWGELICTGTAWDGTFKGKPVPEGVYLYMLTAEDIDGTPHYFSGNVTVLR